MAVNNRVTRAKRFSRWAYCIVVGCAVCAVSVLVLIWRSVPTEQSAVRYLKARGARIHTDAATPKSTEPIICDFGNASIRITDRDIENVVRLRRLRFLDLGGTGLKTEHLKRLSELSDLSTLLLADNDLDSHAIRILKGFHSLEQISLTVTLDDETIEALRQLGTVRRLRLTRCENSALGGLKGMALRECEIVSDQETTYRDLRMLRGLTELRRIVIYGLVVSPEAVGIFRSLPRLEEVVIVGGRIEDPTAFTDLLGSRQIRLIVKEGHVSDECLALAREEGGRVEIGGRPVQK